MSEFNHDMKDERRPPVLLPEGSRMVEVIEMIPDVSKNNNNMFITTLRDIGTQKTQDFFLVSEPKKRWLLKSLLSACGVAAGNDGVYGWDLKDVIGKKVIAVIEHQPEGYIDREGNEKKAMKAKIIEFVMPEMDATGEATAWEDKS